MSRGSVSVVFWTLATLAGFGTWASAQDRDAATLIVDGVVREVYRSASANRDGTLVEIEVSRSELGRGRRDLARVLVPAPGDLVYVHGTGATPNERARVRASLAPRNSGGWEGASADWFVVVEEAPAAQVPAPAPAPAPGPTPAGARPTGRVALGSLGMTGEGLFVSGRFVVKVTGVERGGPARKAGLEVGDIIVAVNDKELKGAESLEAAASRGGPLSLIVLDVNTGKGVRVAVERPIATGAPGENAPEVANAPAPRPAPSGPRKSLGISAEPVQIGPRTAMKVIRIEPGSPAQEAGLEAGDVIVEANGIAVTGPEPLGAAVRKGGNTLNLLVRDTRTGRDTPVTVNIGGVDAPGSAPAPVPAPVPADEGVPGGSTVGLGAVTELIFLDTDSAVKVTEVVPGSPAQRAGLSPGDIITEANGTPILHPNTLNEEVRKGSPRLRLIVVDGKSGKKSTVDVNLTGR